MTLQALACHAPSRPMLPRPLRLRGRKAIRLDLVFILASIARDRDAGRSVSGTFASREAARGQVCDR